MKFISKSAIAVILFFVTTSANALIIEISESADFSGTVISANDSASEGFAQLFASLGDWSINSVIGLSNPILGDDRYDQIHLDSLNVTGGSGTLYIRMTDTDFERGDGAHFLAEFGGTTSGTVSFQSFLDTSNTAFGMGTLLSDSGILSGAFSGQDSGNALIGGPYSLSIFATITHTGQGATSFDYEVTVPEPGTLALLGIGLLGLGLSRRRRVAIVRT